MSDTEVVLKNCRNHHFRGISFKMVHISTNGCIIEQQTTAVNKVNHCPYTFSSIWPSCFCKVKHTGDSCNGTAWYNGVDLLETSGEGVPKVDQDSWRFFANLDISLYVHLLTDLPRV